MRRRKGVTVSSVKSQARSGASRSDVSSTRRVAAKIVPDPKTVADAMSHPFAAKWREAMQAETGPRMPCTRALMVLPPNHTHRPMGNKWVFVTKRDENGTAVRWKARLTAKGFTQVFGRDYQETYSPTLMYKVLRLVLTLAAVWSYCLKQMDVETAFLNARLEEEVYMEHPGVV